MTAGNDVVDLSKWDGKVSVNIGDAFSSDNDKVTVMAKGLAAGANNLKLTSIENLEIVNFGETDPVILKGTNFKGLEAVKLIGDATTLNVFGLTQGIKVDATANADYIIGSDKADTINGGAGNDIIVGNGGVDILTGGNGADEFVVGNAKDFGVDQILDFSAEDKISLVSETYEVNDLKKFDASTFSTVTYKTLDSVLATFAAGGANATKNGDVVIFSYDGKTYALLANGAFNEGTDALVDITGANVASLTESNFGGATSPTPPAPPAPTVKEYPTYAEFVRAVEFGEIQAGKQVAITTLTGADAGLLAVNKTYLDKIAVGGIKGVTGEIVVTVGQTNGVSNNFNSAEFETKLADSVKSSAVMKINGTDKTDEIITTFGAKINGNDEADEITAYAAATIDGGSGADVITAYAAATIDGGSGADVITAYAAASIDGGSGADVITANAAATINGDTENDTIYLNAGGSVNGGAGADEIYVSGSGAATINGGADGDTIDASAATGNVTITGGSGNDIISLGAGADTVVFGASKAANGEDEITNFTAGASGDVLNITTFTGGSISGKVQIESTTAGKGALSDKLVLVSKTAISAGSFDGIGTDKFGLGDGQKLFVVDTTDNSLYFVTAAADMSSGSATVEKVGTITATGDWDAANFA